MSYSMDYLKYFDTDCTPGTKADTYSTVIAVVHLSADSRTHCRHYYYYNRHCYYLLQSVTSLDLDRNHHHCRLQ